jgi:S-DNA-T family DNA segregation ATPase FtsK/SpoIIIE
MSPETKRGLAIVFIFTLTLICALSFLNFAGKAGVYVDWGLAVAFGWGRFFLPVLLLGIGYTMIRRGHIKISWLHYLGTVVAVVSFLGLIHLKVPSTPNFELSFDGLGGGIFGYLISYPLLAYLGFWASLIVFLALLIASVFLLFNTSFEGIWNKFASLKELFVKSDGQTAEEETAEKNEPEKFNAKETESDGDVKAQEVKFNHKGVLEEAGSTYTRIKTPKIKVDLPMNLLDDKISKPTSGDTKFGAERIQQTLKNFNINVEMGEIQVGPTVTQYTFKPAEGVKLSKITALNNDLALALAAHPIRIEAPIPGKSLVGIEVPNKKPAVVRIRENLESESFKNRKNNLSIALGKDVSGKCWSTEISGMPHLLVAGSTGSGKSVCLNTIIISLLYQNNPDTLRMILVDPKRVEFPIYNGIPHLLTPVITDVTKTVYALRWAISEMDHRFDVLSKASKRNLESYNESAKEKMPYIVIIIDELADLMIAAAAEVEGSIIRLTQMARAVGIHLIVATQRPSVDVITGLIKANIPCRIAFSVASLMDSRTILDSAGAEKLVGKGDLLFMSPSSSTPRRLQGTYVTDDEIKSVVTFLKNACPGEPDYNDEIVAKSSGASSFDFNGGKNSSDDQDELFAEAKEEVIKSGKASASYLQRRLGVGYARAAKLIDMLEESGIVGPGNGAKPRDILVDKTFFNTSRMAPLPAEVFDQNEEEPEEEENEDEMPPEEEPAEELEEPKEEDLNFGKKRNSGDDELY